MSDALEESWVKRYEPVLYIVGTLGFVIVAMICWRYLVVDPWAARAELRHYTTPGAFGDAFAPPTGIVSALALGAAVASVLIQSRELRAQGIALQEQARLFQTAASNLAEQARAQKESTRIVTLSATLACIERLEQMDKIGAELVTRILSTMDTEVRTRTWGDRHPKGIWLELTRARGSLPTDFQGFEVLELFFARRSVALILDDIHKSRKLEPPDNEFPPPFIE